jgi:Domain of unknown function (DUF4340)
VNQKQFILVLIVLVVLVAGGAGVAWWKRASYEVADTRVGQKLIADFKVADVTQIAIADAQGAVTLARGERGWTVKERGDFPADFDPVRDLLVKLAELKVVQTEGLTDAIKPRMQLAAPGSGAKPEETGVTVKLQGRDGKNIADMVLGKRMFKPSQMAGIGGEGLPSGRYVWVASDPQRVNVVSEPFSNVTSKPQQWHARELLRVEHVKAIAAIGPDGKEKWSVAKDSEAGDWKLRGAGKLDPGKAQDAASTLYGVQINDVPATVSDSEAGFDKPTRIRAETFDGWTYELAIGKPAANDRYYVKSTVNGSVPESRTAPAEEKAEEKEKADKQFTERKEMLAAKLEREKALSGRTVLLAKSTVEPLLRDRSALLVVDKPKDQKKKKAAKK